MWSDVSGKKYLYFVFSVHILQDLFFRHASNVKSILQGCKVKFWGSNVSGFCSNHDRGLFGAFHAKYLESNINKL